MCKVNAKQEANMLDFAKSQSHMLNACALDQIAQHCERTAELMLPTVQKAMINEPREVADAMYADYDTFAQLGRYIRKMMELQDRE